MKRPALLLAFFFGVVGSASAQPNTKPDAKGLEFFENKIRPVLIDNCYQCHDAAAEKAKKLRGGLRLDTRAGLLKGGDSGPALIPGKVNQGHLLAALKHTGDTKMPPKGKLPMTVIADFARWIEMGAPDPRDGTAVAAKTIDIEAGRAYWAFQPLRKEAPPPIKNQAWARTPLDRFILARLEEKSLQPQAAANRERLMRRAYFDLWGLPPSPADLDAFLQDAAPDAYERMIDRLLEKEHYGERWGRHWLDLVRFAESGGYEFDKDRPNAYHYRDFVIKALNQDMPYDQFVRWQIAGDHLKKDDLLAASATGFLVAGPFPGQVTAKTLALIRYNHLDDMLSTLGSSMLGLSVGCARCHDHKYDPVPMQDYYRLLACLARTDSVDAKIDPEPAIYLKAKAAFDQEQARVLSVRDKFLQEELPARLKKWRADPSHWPAGGGPIWWTLDLGNLKAKSKTTTFKKLDDGSILVGGKAEAGETYTFTATIHSPALSGFRLDALPDPSLPKTGPGRGADGKFKITDFAVTAAPRDGKGKPVPLKVLPPKTVGDHKPGEATMAGYQVVLDDQTFKDGMTLTFTLKFDSNEPVGRLRLSYIAAYSPPPMAFNILLAPQHILELSTLLGKRDVEQLQPAEINEAARWFRKLDPATNDAFKAVENFNQKAPQPKLVNVFMASSGKGGDVSFLIRGEPERKNGVAQPGFMQVLMKATAKEELWTGKSEKTRPAVEPRVALANWITDTDQGAGLLLARVIVNRLWQHHMGRGIVATPNDFGVQGEPPTHPELLDYLAGELIKNGWKLKPIHKLIMTSAVYRQTGEVDQANMKVDPQNRLWWRRPARRLEAEAIRDTVLAVSGTLDPAMYGAGSLDGNINRRSVYLRVKRSQMVPLLQIFDVPEAIQSIGERTTSTVPTQSLAFLNSPFVRQRAEKFAARIKPKTEADLPQAITQAYLIALSRQPTSAERDRMLAFLRSQAESYGTNARSQDLALADFCQVMMCLNEFVYVD